VNYRLIAPYATWMALMMALPATAGAYALRTAATAAVLLFCVFGRWRAHLGTVRGFFVGLLVGLAVFALWIAPETLFRGLLPTWLFPLAPATDVSPYAPETCGWTLTLVRLVGSAFVISVAEELFFRRWLVDFAGFGWMVVLFAVEHGDRWAVGAATGVVYGLLARRLGLASAIVAHATTNLVLGLWVIIRGQWQFW